MDLDLLFYIAIAVVYFVIQALASKKNKSTRPQGTTTPESLPDGASRDVRSQDVTLDDALREIRQALGMGAPTPTAPPPPATPHKPAPPPRPSKPSTPPRRPRDQPQLIDSAPKSSRRAEFIPHKKHYSDDEFEALPQGIPGFDDPHYAASKRASQPRLTAKIDAARPARTQRLIDRLRNPAAAREAFLLHEILGPPRAFRRR